MFDIAPDFVKRLQEGYLQDPAWKHALNAIKRNNKLGDNAAELPFELYKGLLWKTGGPFPRLCIPNSRVTEVLSSIRDGNHRGFDAPQFEHKNTRSSVTGKAPNEIKKGFTPLAVSDVIAGRQPRVDVDLPTARIEAHDAIAIAAMSVKHYYDRTHTARFFNIGDRHRDSSVENTGNRSPGHSKCSSESVDLHTSSNSHHNGKYAMSSVSIISSQLGWIHSAENYLAYHQFEPKTTKSKRSKDLEHRKTEHSTWYNTKI
ncbi:hypothetical protein B0H63DRAFT_456169 [Podospora didyma]|uniref:Uncharacterized protein n=1 Tax=Podospora didyma TaxID=330526 RepID=A0AAE0JY58_9PEZI|nr:hypothetical protein B0H63DRAFT_456169 [Podospora didyma]